MKKTVISFFEISERWQIDLLNKEFPAPRYSLRFNPGRLMPANVRRYADSEALSVFIHSQLNEKVLSRLPKLRFIATNSTGFDHIDTAFCKKRGIAVANVPLYAENTVAEHTFALILSLSRKIVESAVRTKQGRFTLEGLRGFDLKGKTIGVVGTGRIGQHVIRMAHGFEMKILAYDLYPDKSLENHYPLRYVTLEALMRRSDIITLHAPYNKDTRHMINARNIGLLKKGSMLINTSRGGLIETAALLKGLKSRSLRAVGLDVLEEEGVIAEESALISHYIPREQLATVLQDHKLLAMDNVLVTPHNAFNSDEAILRIITTTVANLKAWKKGEPTNVV